MTLRIPLAAALVCAALATPALAQETAPAAPPPSDAPIATGDALPTFEAPAGRLDAAGALAALAPRLAGVPGVRAVTAHATLPGALTVVASREFTVELDRVLERANRPGADAAAEIDAFAAVIAEQIRRTDPFKREALRVIVRPGAAIDAFERDTAIGGAVNAVVRRPFAPGLEEVVVADTPTSIALMPVARLRDLDLGATQAFDVARANLGEAAREVTWEDRSGLLVATWDGAYEASLLALDPVWRRLEARLGGPVAVAVPLRGRVVAGRANRAADMSRLRAIARDEATGPQKMSDRVLVRRGAGWAVDGS